LNNIPLGDGLRNVPIQARSRERLQRVLDAAEKVLAEGGAAALTTTRIAEVAGIPIGSLYHYFPDKAAIVDALALRYWSDFEDLVAGVAEMDEREPLDDPLAMILDTLAVGFRSRPDFRALWYGDLRTERVRDATRVARAGFTRSVERILAVHWPDADAGLRARVARMVVLVGDGLLREAFRIDPDGDADLLDEGRRVLDAYIRERIS
jgi:AcrR family transcriptional regulator